MQHPLMKKSKGKKEQKKFLDRTVIKAGHDTSATSVGQFMGQIVFMAIFGFIIFSVYSAIDNADPIDKVKGALDSRNNKKVYCSERAESATTDYAAKKIYKACMSN